MKDKKCRKSITNLMCLGELKIKWKHIKRYVRKYSWIRLKWLTMLTGICNRESHQDRDISWWSYWTSRIKKESYQYPGRSRSPTKEKNSQADPRLLSSNLRCQKIIEQCPLGIKEKVMQLKNSKTNQNISLVKATGIFKHIKTPRIEHSNNHSLKSLVNRFKYIKARVLQ